MLARDRVELLLDEDSPFLELMPLMGWGQVRKGGGRGEEGGRKGGGRGEEGGKRGEKGGRGGGGG